MVLLFQAEDVPHVCLRMVEWSDRNISSKLIWQQNMNLCILIDISLNGRLHGVENIYDTMLKYTDIFYSSLLCLQVGQMREWFSAGTRYINFEDPSKVGGIWSWKYEVTWYTSGMTGSRDHVKMNGPQQTACLAKGYKNNWYTSKWTDCTP